jgi:hypothetical protein
VTPLDAVVSARLLAAGLGADPALAALRVWNTAARQAAGADPARAGVRGWNQADRRRQAPR